MRPIKPAPVYMPDGTTRFVLAGSARMFNESHRGHVVKLAAEIKLPATLKIAADISVRDFGAFNPADTLAACLVTRDLIVAGETVYFGCAGGIGRTGTFLACLRAVCHPAFRPYNAALQSVRFDYYAHAVETSEQENLIHEIARLANEYERRTPEVVPAEPTVDTPKSILGHMLNAVRWRF